jgi:hypothetical protein
MNFNIPENGWYSVNEEDENGKPSETIFRRCLRKNGRDVMNEHIVDGFLKYRTEFRYNKSGKNTATRTTSFDKESGTATERTFYY